MVYEDVEDVEKPSKSGAPIATIVKMNVDKKACICRFSVYLSVMRLSVKVGRYGRIVLPRQLREKYGVQEGSRLIVTDFMGRICLVPAKTYEKPTEALYGCVRLEKPIVEPKRVAREYIRKKLAGDLQ